MIGRLLLIPEPELHGVDVLAFLKYPFLQCLILALAADVHRNPCNATLHWAHACIVPILSETSLHQNQESQTERNC